MTEERLTIGPHTSIAKGFKKAGEEAASIDATTFQFFTRNPRGGNAKALDPVDVAALTDMMVEKKMGSLLAHAPYTLNMASNNPNTRDFAKRAFREDLDKLECLPCHLYNFHPGSHVGQGVAHGIELILDILNAEMQESQMSIVLLETMSGKGSEIGGTFEELHRIIDGSKYPDLLGVCLDTCHVYSAGYDIVRDLDGVLEHFDQIVGLDSLKAIHLNDSMTPFGSHKDRHAKIGEGTMGIETFKNIVTHPQLKHLPFFLETPQQKYNDYQKEIELLRSF